MNVSPLSITCSQNQPHTTSKIIGRTPRAFWTTNGRNIWCVHPNQFVTRVHLSYGTVPVMFWLIHVPYSFLYVSGAQVQLRVRLSLLCWLRSRTHVGGSSYRVYSNFNRGGGSDDFGDPDPVSPYPERVGACLLLVVNSLCIWHPIISNTSQAFMLKCLWMAHSVLN
jgi:hypothetical protein